MPIIVESPCSMLWHCDNVPPVMYIKQFEIPAHYFLFGPFFNLSSSLYWTRKELLSAPLPSFQPNAERKARSTLTARRRHLISIQHNYIDFTHQSNMGIAPRASTSWASMRIERSLSSRGSVLRILVLVLLFSTFAYIIWLPIFYLFQTFQGASSHQKQPMILEPGDE